MNRDGGGVKAGGEVSVGQLKVLMGILREQNHSHRWFIRLYLAAKNEGTELSYKITSKDSGVCLGYTERSRVRESRVCVSTQCKYKVKRMCVH